MELRQGHLFIAINVYRYVYFNTCLFFHWLTIPPAAVHPPEPRSPGTGPCRWSPSRCSTWTRRKPWLMTGEPSAHTSSLSLWSSTKEKQKKNLSRPCLDEFYVNIIEIMIRRYKDFFFLLIFIENILITLTCILETKVLWNHQCWTSSFSDLVLNADIFGGVFCREQVDARLLHDLRNHCQYIGQIKLTVTQSSQNRQKRSLKNDNIQ